MHSYRTQVASHEVCTISLSPPSPPSLSLSLSLPLSLSLSLSLSPSLSLSLPHTHTHTHTHKYTQQEEDSRAALMLEQSALSQLYLQPPSTRRYAFRMVLAGLRYLAAGQVLLGTQAYR